MNKPNKAVLWIVILAVVVGIWYLESQKPNMGTAVIPQIIDLSLTGDTTTNSTVTSTPIKKITKNLPKAIELSDPTGFINAGPFKLADVVGKKVVLVDFWTYSCINCLRTLPYLNAWYDKYKDFGLQIVGVHTPEFDFEKDIDNVSEAVKKLGVQYPVVLDSNYGTWNAYNNHYWPHEYLVDIDGYIVDDHIGEGGYDDTERAIQKALQERSDKLGLNLKIPTGISTPKDAISMDSSKIATPETYFGSSRNEFLGKGLTLQGTWDIQPQYAESTSATSKILYKYTAKNVYFVASSKNGVTIKIVQDDKQIGTQVIKDNQLYTLIQGLDYSAHTLEIDVEGAGLDAFTLTFG
jgi:thiol-disulfide isomerase/thioredoxin